MVTRIERMGPGAWERVRAVRLRALSDAPDAFSGTLAEAQAHRPDLWRERLANRRAVTFLAVVEGDDVGMMIGAQLAARPGTAGLFGAWVAPEARGRGVGDLLVEAVVAWARAAGYERLVLDVADDNVMAMRLYERMGFEPTGAVGTLPAPRTHIRERELALALTER